MGLSVEEQKKMSKEEALKALSQAVKEGKWYPILAQKAGVTRTWNPETKQYEIHGKSVKVGKSTVITTVHERKFKEHPEYLEAKHQVQKTMAEHPEEITGEKGTKFTPEEVASVEIEGIGEKGIEYAYYKPNPNVPKIDKTLAGIPEIEEVVGRNKLGGIVVRTKEGTRVLPPSIWNEIEKRSLVNLKKDEVAFPLLKALEMGLITPEDYRKIYNKGHNYVIFKQKDVEEFLKRKRELKDIEKKYGTYWKNLAEEYGLSKEQINLMTAATENKGLNPYGIGLGVTTLWRSGLGLEPVVKAAFHAVEGKGFNIGEEFAKSYEETMLGAEAGRPAIFSGKAKPIETAKVVGQYAGESALTAFSFVAPYLMAEKGIVGTVSKIALRGMQGYAIYNAIKNPTPENIGFAALATVPEIVGRVVAKVSPRIKLPFGKKLEYEEVEFKPSKIKGKTITTRGSNKVFKTTDLTIKTKQGPKIKAILEEIYYLDKNGKVAEYKYRIKIPEQKVKVNGKTYTIPKRTIRGKGLREFGKYWKEMYKNELGKKPLEREILESESKPTEAEIAERLNQILSGEKKPWKLERTYKPEGYEERFAEKGIEITETTRKTKFGGIEKKTKFVRTKGKIAEAGKTGYYEETLKPEGLKEVVTEEGTIKGGKGAYSEGAYGKLEAKYGKTDSEEFLKVEAETGKVKEAQKPYLEIEKGGKTTTRAKVVAGKIKGKYGEIPYKIEEFEVPPDKFFTEAGKRGFLDLRAKRAVIPEVEKTTPKRNILKELAEMYAKEQKGKKPTIRKTPEVEISKGGPKIEKPGLKEYANPSDLLKLKRVPPKEEYIIRTPEDFLEISKTEKIARTRAFERLAEGFKGEGAFGAHPSISTAAFPRIFGGVPSALVTLTIGRNRKRAYRIVYANQRKVPQPHINTGAIPRMNEETVNTKVDSLLKIENQYVIGQEQEEEQEQQQKLDNGRPPPPPHPKPPVKEPKLPRPEAPKIEGPGLPFFLAFPGPHVGFGGRSVKAATLSAVKRRKFARVEEMLNISQPAPKVVRAKPKPPSHLIMPSNMVNLNIGPRASRISLYGPKKKRISAEVIEEIKKKKAKKKKKKEVKKKKKRRNTNPPSHSVPQHFLQL